MTNSNALSRSSARLLPAALMTRWQRNPTDPVAFAEAHRRFDGAPMVVPPALHAIYRDTHPFVAVQKPAQAGATEWALLSALHFAATHEGRSNVLYLTPTQEVADRISQQRLAGALRVSPPLAALLSEAGPQRKELRTVGGSPIYFLGADQPTQYTGIDADFVICDEFDLMKVPEVLSHAQARTRSSRDPRLRFLSTPTIPSYGINALIEMSDEQHYELQCTDCQRWIEPLFPDHVDFERGCVVCLCMAPLPRDGPGRWVARRPGAAMRGYVLNRLTLPNPPLAAMRLAAGGTLMRQEEFWRQDLGLPFVTSEARLSAEDLDRCIAGDDPADQLPFPLPADVTLAIGVDVGISMFWVVVHAFHRERGYLLKAARVEGEWDDLLAFCAQVAQESGRSIGWGAVDALPDTRGARYFIHEMETRQSAYICRVYYNRTDEHEFHSHRINAQRTLAIDEMMYAFRRGHVVLPRRVQEAADGQFYNHMQALVRTTVPDDFGQPIPTYVHTHPDDFAHAETYMWLAANRYGRHNGWAPGG